MKNLFTAALKNDLSHNATDIQWLTSCHKKCYGMMLHKILTCMYNIILTCMYNIMMSSAPVFAYSTENFNLQAQSGGLIALLK